MRTLITLLMIATLAGCATTRPDANYNAYIEASARAEQQAAIAQAALADATACNGGESCVIAVKALAAMAVQGAGNRGQLQQYQRQPGAFERVTLGVLGALPGLGQVWATVESGKRNVDIARLNAAREIAIADSWAGVTTGVANAFGALPPSTYIGGDQISGHVGDTVGRDQISGQQHIGDWRTGDDTRRDTIGRDRTDYGSGNRIASPGPYRDIGNGPRCEGDGCQPVNPTPEPEG